MVYPIQILVDAELTLIVGVLETLTIDDAEFSQPLISVPNNEYVVFEEGETVIELEIVPVPDHVYVFAPIAFKVTDCPEQIVAEVGVIDTLGNALAVILTVFVFKQPNGPVPETV
jgi:hypothetical protein